MTRTLFTDDKIMHWYTPFLRINGLIFSFTTGTSGGIFAPSLSAGASIGSAIAGWFHYNDSNTNLLILSGMVAFLTGVTRSPFTAAILVLEMTDRHSVIFHLMLAALLANIFAALVDHHSIYEHLKLRFLHDLLKTKNRKHPFRCAPIRTITNAERDLRHGMAYEGLKKFACLYFGSLTTRALSRAELFQNPILPVYAA